MYCYLHYHIELVYLFTALVPSLTAPGEITQTVVWIPRLEIVCLPVWVNNFDYSFAILSNKSFTNEFMMFIALLEMPVSAGCTFFNIL